MGDGIKKKPNLMTDWTPIAQKLKRKPKRNLEGFSYENQAKDIDFHFCMYEATPHGGIT
jgi:hypothetical protein